MSADWSSVRRFAGLSKNIRDAASTPTAVVPFVVP